VAASKKSAKKSEPEKKGKRKSADEKSANAITKIPTANDYLAGLRAMKGVDKDDFTMFGEEVEGRGVTEWIPTGILALDRLTGGGWPVGRIIEVAAWEGVGKTTLLDQSIAQVQRMGGVAALIDSEQGRDPKYTQRLGVDPKQLLVGEAATMDDGFEQVERFLSIQESFIARAKDPKKIPPMLMIYDSLGGHTTKYELEHPDAAQVSEHARMISRHFRRFTLRMHNARVAFVFSNHFYNQIGGYGGRVSFGGKGIRYFTSLRVWLTKKLGLKIGERDVGHVVECSLKKTRVSAPKEPVEIGLLYGAGFHNAYSLFEWGKTNGRPGIPGHKWIQQNGSWYHLTLPDGTAESFQRQYLGLGELFQQKPALYEAIANDYLDSDPVV
jgi:recombination protein RecA